MDLEELIIQALDHENIPPRVPSFVQGIMPYFYEQWDNKYGDDLDESYIKITDIKDVTIHAHLGFDSTWSGFPGPTRLESVSIKKKVAEANNKLDPELKSKGYYIAKNGGLYKVVNLQGYPNNFLVGGTIKTEEEWNEWFGDDPGEYTELTFDPVDRFNKAYHKALEEPHPVMLFPTTHLIMEPLIAMLDMGRIGYFARKKPAFLRKVIEYIMEPSIRRFKLMCESDARVLMVPDDCAYKGRPILNPKAYKEFIIPYWKLFADMAHKAGKILIMHSDGVVEPYYNDLIEAGVDAHQSLEPGAGNDLAFLKEKYGNKLSFIGNIDCSNLLTFGTIEEVACSVKDTLKAGMPNSGYMFSPCTDIINVNKLENVEAMMDTWRKYGTYPINID